MRMRAVALFVLTATIAGPLPAHSQGTARSMDIDTSIRSSGMAGASTAVFFGDDPNSWANPALLGYASGVRYQRGRTQLVPGLATDVFFNSEHVRVGGGGAGLVVSGRPFLEGVEVDYGPDVFSGFETVESWGFGVSALRVVEGIRRAAGGAPAPRSHKADVSFGMNFKRTNVVLVPGFFEDSGSTVDWGVLLRATPLDRSDPGPGVPLRLDAALGFGVINANDEIFLRFPPTRQKRTGIAMHLAVDPQASGLSRSGSRPWYLEGLSPLFSFGLAGDWTRASAGGQGRRYDTWGAGVEATMLNVLTLRGGYYYDRIGEIQDPAFGFALTLPVGKLAGVRYEESRFPQARNSGLSDQRRMSFTVWVDPVEALGLSRREGAE
jgi:hypothetical protein